MPARYLIVNGDDFGLSAGVNRGIARAHEEGVLTSSSLMVRQLAAGPAADYARAHPRLSVGLHLDLEEWIYVNDEWMPRYRAVPANNPIALQQEVARQIEAFRRLLGRNPTHLDSHQHVHRDEPARTVVSRMANEIGVPLRDFTPRVHYCGDFYGQTGEGYPYPEGIRLESLLKTLANLPAGVTELGCHPGEDDDLDSVYRLERSEEVRVLCDPRLRRAIESLGIVLCSFADLPAVSHPSPDS